LATIVVNVELTSGKWYYEVELVEANTINIGWIDSEATIDGEKAVGADSHGWAF